MKLKETTMLADETVTITTHELADMCASTVIMMGAIKPLQDNVEAALIAFSATICRALTSTPDGVKMREVLDDITTKMKERHNG